MTTFIEQLAADLYARYGRDISSLRILFPSRRAQLFFAEALSHLTDVPLWQPHFTSLDTLMTTVAGIEHGERVRLITELYEIYRQFHPDEKFDKFYFWGDMLLSDFDSIDKYMVDADVLFANIDDLKQIESDLSYITDKQWQVIDRFWSVLNGDPDPSLHKQRFLKVWRTLCPIYHRFRERLDELGIAYGGMVQRRAAERIACEGFQLDDGFDADGQRPRYVIAGFNALSACEKRLFDYLSVNRRTDFYWDYDNYYYKDKGQEAGLFVRENLIRYPHRPDFRPSADNFAAQKQFTAVAAASNVLQCKYVHQLLKNMAKDAGKQGSKLDKRTAIVLTDENLLSPLLYSMPEGIDLNITMGYPVRQTVAYSFVERLIELQNRRRESSGGVWFHHTDVLGLLAHPYLCDMAGDAGAALSKAIVERQQVYVPQSELRATPLLAELFASVGEWRSLSDYIIRMLALAAQSDGDGMHREAEFLSVIADNMTMLRNSLDECRVEITLPIYASLLRRHLQTVRIPFEGKPLQGVQIMGILETRNLDFDNVIILSMNDDNFPGSRTVSSSFIPYGLRAAYGLPTPEHHEGVYAYYFYRLIQRATNIYMVYCSRSDEKSSGEASRYIRQLDYESQFEIHKIDFGVDINLGGTAPFTIAKQGETAAQLARFTDGEATLSPTALFRYIACPMRFYFASVAHIRCKEDMAEEIDAPMFGTILHYAMQRLYEPLRQTADTAGAIAAITAERIEREVDRAVNEKYLRREKNSNDDYGGDIIMVKEIICRYIRNGILAYDTAHPDFRIENLEHKVTTPFEFTIGDKRSEVVFQGTADRIDRLANGQIRVVDYKTGAPHLEFDGIEALFRGTGKQRLSAIIQTLLYSMMISRSENRPVCPALYYVRDIGREDYSPMLVECTGQGHGKRRVQVTDYASFSEEFERLLAETLAELFDESIPFVQCEDRDTCAYCDYRDICRR